MVYGNHGLNGTLATLPVEEGRRRGGENAMVHSLTEILVKAPQKNALPATLSIVQLMVFGRLGPRGHRVVVPVVLGSKSAPVTVWALFIMEATVWGIGTKLKPATLTLVQSMVTGTNGQTGPPVTSRAVEDPSGADDAVNNPCLEEKTVQDRL